jgi:hypothetical protein
MDNNQNPKDLYEQEFKFLKGRIKIPYEWTCGTAPSKFLTSLRDKKKILGAKCPSCKKVYIPPQEYCGKCFVEIKDYTPVSDEGEVITYTVVHKPFIKTEMNPPYIVALIKLDGADTSILHFIGECELKKIKSNIPVKAQWNEERKGNIMDIKYFKPI